MKAKLLFVALLSLVPQFAQAGHETGNGGDAFASEFVMIGADLVDRLRSDRAKPFRNSQLADAVGTTIVSSVDEELFLLNGTEVDALNYPGLGIIKFNRERWKAIRGEASLRTRLTLVLHEYLGIMGVSDIAYRVSVPTIARLDLSQYKLDWSGSANPVRTAYVRFEKGSRFSTNAEFNPENAEEGKAVVVVNMKGEARKVYIKKATTIEFVDNGNAAFQEFTIKVFGLDRRLLGKTTFRPEPCNATADRCTSPDVKVGDVLVRFSSW